jgi:hypothetical protein
MESGVAILLLVLALVFGALVRSYLVGGGFRYPGWLVTRAKDPISFWLVVVAYGAVAAAFAVIGIAGLLHGSHWISN